jgi:DNA-binding IclR family transcriptional regulator
MAKPTDQTAPAQTVPALERALSLFELLAEARRGLSLSEISRRLDIPKSSAHLIVTTLERRGYLQRHAQTGHFCFGLKLVSLTRTALASLDLRETARPFLLSLTRQTGLTAHLAVLEESEAVIIDKIEAPGLLKVATWVGRRMDVNCTGVGKALIAYASDEELASLLGGRALPRHNHRTVTSLMKLKQELRLVRRRGYSFDNEEDEVGLRCLGAPILSAGGRAVAALSLAGTTAQIPLHRVSALAEAVKEAAASIAAQLPPRDE